MFDQSMRNARKYLHYTLRLDAMVIFLRNGIFLYSVLQLTTYMYKYKYEIECDYTLLYYDYYEYVQFDDKIQVSRLIFFYFM